MKKLALLQWVFFSAFLFAQKHPSPISNAPHSPSFLVPMNSVSQNDFVKESELEIILKQKANLPEEVEMTLTKTLQSAAFSHYRYDLYRDGHRIFGAVLHAAVSKEGKLKLLQFPELPSAVATGDFPETEEAQQIQQTVGADEIVATETVWFVQDGFFHRGLLTELSDAEIVHRQVLFADGEILMNKDLHRYFHGPNDTTVSVLIFDPDPLTTAQKPYGAPYADFDDQSVPELEAERKMRNTIFTNDNGTLRPENDFVKITEFSQPNIPPISSSSSHQFHFTRDHSGFEDVNALFHITHQRQHLVDLGYPDLPDYQIQVDVHAIGGADQSFFAFNHNPPRLYFGEGGVDDAEDADVIIHEFTHAVIWEAAPDATTDTERGCIEEALGDYFAISYSRTVNQYDADQVFNWDSGGGKLWPGRQAKSNKCYPNLSFASGNIYAHTDAVVQPLSEIYNMLGRNTADQLVLEAIYNLTPSTTIPQLADFMVMADSALFSGANAQVIYNAFANICVYPQISIAENDLVFNDLKIFNTNGFARGESLTLLSEDENISGYQILDVAGQTVWEVKDLRAKRLEILGDGLRAGIYILYVETEKGAPASFKILKGGL